MMADILILCYILVKPQIAGGWEISHHPKVFRLPDGHLVDELYCKELELRFKLDLDT